MPALTVKTDAADHAKRDKLPEFLSHRFGPAAVIPKDTGQPWGVTSGGLRK
jgi:hypothetical protein